VLIVRTEEDFNSAIEFILANDILAYDIETTGLNVRQDSIIGIGISNHLDGFYIPIKSWQHAELVNVLQHPVLLISALELLKSKKLLMHNGSFDGRFTMYDLGVDLVPAMHCDTMLLKHTCDEDFPFGLKEIATKLWGSDATEEKAVMLSSIKAAGGSAKEYYKASTATLAQYCVKDCLLTFRVYAHYSKELQRQGLDKFFYTEEVMPLYREVVIPMEVSGVAVDTELLQKSASEISLDIACLEVKIQDAIEPMLGIFTQWLLDKDFPLSTPKGKVPVWARKGASQLEAWQKANTGYMFNLESKHHLKKLFFDTLGEVAVSHTDLGNPQVDDDFLELMAAKYSWAADLRTFNKLRKLEGTYVRKLLDSNENGRFYPSFNMHRTTSGRLGGDMQQLPRPIKTGDPLVIKHTNRVRAFVIPGPGCKLLSSDFQQLEPSVFAHISGDTRLQAIFRTGMDFYSEVAIMTLNLKNVSADKSAENYLGKLYPEVRQQAKVYALGVAYGMTGYKLQFEIGVTQDEAERLVQNYLAAFPSLASWMARSQDEAIYNGAVKTETGRVRHLPLAKILFNKYGASLRDSLRLWKDYHGNTPLYAEAKAARKTYINLLNNSINHKVQGLAASILNRASIAIAAQLKAQGLQARPVLSIHDELVLEVPDAEIETVRALVKDCMENTYKLTVPLYTNPIVGNSFAECK